MRLRLPVWLAAAAAVAVAQEQREHNYPAILTPGDGVLLFSPASAASAWMLSNNSDTNSSAVASTSQFVASANATNASASFAFYGSSFEVLGSGNGELVVSVLGFTDAERDPRRSPDWDSPHHDANASHATERGRSRLRDTRSMLRRVECFTATTAPAPSGRM